MRSLLRIVGVLQTGALEARIYDRHISPSRQLLELSSVFVSAPHLMPIWIVTDVPIVKKVAEPGWDYEQLRRY